MIATCRVRTNHEWTRQVSAFRVRLGKDTLEDAKVICMRICRDVAAVTACPIQYGFLGFNISSENQGAIRTHPNSLI